MCCPHQFPDIRQWRHTKTFLTVDELSSGSFGKPETTHARSVVNSHQIIERRQSAHGPLLIGSGNLLPTIQQCASPAVGESIGETGENIAFRSGVLDAGIVLQILTEKNITIFGKPLFIIRKAVCLATAHRVAGKLAYQLKRLQPVKVGIHK